MDIMMNNFDDFEKMSRTNMELATNSFGEFFNGFQELISETTDYSKKTFEDGTNAFEKISSAKSVDQAIDIQTKFAKKSYEGYMSYLTSVTEKVTELTKGAYQPAEKIFSK